MFKDYIIQRGAIQIRDCAQMISVILFTLCSGIGRQSGSLLLPLII